MCRSIAKGGRRCPAHSNPIKIEERNAERRAKETQNKPLSNTKFKNRLEYAYKAIDRRVKAGEETINIFSTTRNNAIEWQEERLEAHNKIIKELMESWNHVPSKGEAIFAGGLGGAGKSTVLSKFAGVDQTQYATVNPDDIKEIMAKHNLIPKVPGLSPMEASPLVHEEASYIAKRIAKLLIKQRKNIIYDLTMSSYNSTKTKIDELKEAGYKVDAVFVEISPEVSLQRSQSRYREGVDDYVTGKGGYGGRLLPKNIIEDQITDSGITKNRETFNNLKNSNIFNNWGIWDNSVNGRNPIVLEKS